MTQRSETVSVAGIDFTIAIEAAAGYQPDIRVQVEALPEMADTYLLRCTVEDPAHQNFVLRDLTIHWDVPIKDMHGLYWGGNPRTELTYLPFWHHTKSICAHTGLPFVALINRNGNNRTAIGTLDQITETQFNATLSEQTRCYHFDLQKPANKDTAGQTLPVIGRWEETLFISCADKPWPDVLRHYADVSNESIQPAMPVPEQAYDPVFCSWTAIHHVVSHEWIMHNARVAAELGFGTWITDDGWFIEEGVFGNYRYAGDWEPCAAKFPDLKEHVRAVQALGFRYVLWVAPFMVGVDSQAAQKYEHLLTTGQERERFHNLSPWHNETERIIVELLERLVKDYELDGLKIDFIDSVAVHSERQAGASDATLGSQVYHILSSACDRLLMYNPDLLIEFRNSYANLASRRYANIYRSSDVPLNFGLNRWQVTMLRLLVPDRAMHMDPALWHPDTSDEDVAVHLINVIAGVPMVSIELDQYPPAHLDLIWYWIGFYNAHRQTIIHGDFQPELRSGYIPSIRFLGEDDVIIGLYDDVPLTLEPEARTVWLLNASNRPYIDLLPSDLKGPHTLITRDKFGNIVAEQTVHFPVTRIAVEVGGNVEIKAAN